MRTEDADEWRFRKADKSNWRPTNALPGTAAKKRVLMERWAAGLPLFHPEDANWSKELVDMLDGEACNVMGLSFTSIGPVLSQFERLTHFEEEP
jgi:hypothetical protein